jgi:CheY-like chemotaxis protein
MSTVLVVDDDSDVLDIAVEVLNESGYRVVEAANATEALVALERETDIGLLFTDIVMPGMNGFELARRAKSISPNLRVLFTSGFVRDLPDRADAESARLLKKPWRASQLEEEVRNALAP